MAANRTTHLTVRARPSERRLVEAAAAVTDQTVSEFTRRAALDRAREVMAAAGAAEPALRGGES